LAAAVASMIYKIGVAKAAASNRTPNAGAAPIRLAPVIVEEHRFTPVAAMSPMIMIRNATNAGRNRTRKSSHNGWN
ncbi:MAG: hypothetical protein NTX50_12815, partial [Candidatus Sumerlaeota bacterium]|nr:hypothetical protein [Candidatus Sumerlaeota bacterium]